MDGRGKRGRKSYADMAVRQLDRSTATFKQLVEHADARERLKADEEKRMRVSCTMRLQSNSLRPMVALWNGLQFSG